MYRARSLAAAIVATLFTAATLTLASWATAEVAARGVNPAKLPALLTVGNFSALEWPFRVDSPPAVVHVTFYLSITIIAFAAGIATLIALAKSSPRNGSAAFIGTWFGVVIGSIAAGVAIYFLRTDALAQAAGSTNAALATTLQGLVLGGLIVGWVPAVFAWVTFKIANRKRAAEYAEAQAISEGTATDENPFDLAPGSISESRPVEPGFTYPSGDEYTDGSYRDADLPAPTNHSDMTFSDPTDATGEDLQEHADDYGIATPRADAEDPLRKTGS